MTVMNEKIDYDNPLLSFKIFRATRDRDVIINWHYHKEIEILAVSQGVLDVYIEEEFYSLKPGDVLLIGSGQLHRDRSFQQPGVAYTVFQFDIQTYFDHSLMPYMRFFSDARRPLNRLNAVLQNNRESARQIFEYVQEIYEETQNKKDGYEIAVSILIKQIVLSLLRSDPQRLSHEQDDADVIRLKPALDYVDQNICGKVQVEQASKTVNLSYYYFVKYFKKVFGMSFMDYVNFKKIKRAERLLLTKEQISIADVGEAVGMPNMAHFYKIFKKFNRCSPNEFRKKMTVWSQASTESN